MQTVASACTQRFHKNRLVLSDKNFLFSSGAKLTETGEGGVNGAHVPKHVSKENNPELVNVIALLQSMEGENVKEKLMKIKSATTKSLAQVCIKALIRSGQKSELPKRFYL